jgi:Flp pilus assembly pilin Flp
MNQIRGFLVKMREYQRGQTMTEYALILAAIAVVCIVGYDTMGTTVSGLVTSVNTYL